MSDLPVPDSWPRAATESWPRAFRRAFWLALWVLALLILAAELALTGSNWHSGDDLGTLAIYTVCAVGLIGLPISYRRHVPQAVRWPATKRAWLLAIPLVVVLAVPVLLFVANVLRGALRG